jgi:acyl carrier protein
MTGPVFPERIRIMLDRTDLLNTLKSFLQEDTEVSLDRVDEGASLREGLGMDSVDLVGIIMRIEGRYHIRLSHAELEPVKTVGQLLDLIITKVTAQSDPARHAA